MKNKILVLTETFKHNRDKNLHLYQFSNEI